jgi:tellurite resistance protein TerC
VAIGILTMRFAAGLFTNLIEKIPALSVAAYVLVFNIGIEFLIERIFDLDIGDSARFAINIGTLLLAVIYQEIPFLQRVCRKPFKVCKIVFHAIDVALNFVLSPLNWFFGKLGGWIGQLFRRRVSANR